MRRMPKEAYSRPGYGYLVATHDGYVRAMTLKAAKHIAKGRTGQNRFSPWGGGLDHVWCDGSWWVGTLGGSMTRTRRERIKQ